MSMSITGAGNGVPRGTTSGDQLCEWPRARIVRPFCAQSLTQPGTTEACASASVRTWSTVVYSDQSWNGADESPCGMSGDAATTEACGIGGGGGGGCGNVPSARARASAASR